MEFLQRFELFLLGDAHNDYPSLDYLNLFPKIPGRNKSRFNKFQARFGRKTQTVLARLDGLKHLLAGLAAQRTALPQTLGADA
ncbi:hypothetical protein [Oryzomonas rubra]|uniref:Uncharacterized protein n=1 Tax=Oryzomonas rubra TaxID=2509454 RepID=A0A5A9XMD5_9BACT|nr:hypothetical protein [Oryzomonas rubra]KAA0894246.1 hypothetical protein ET418_04640 [Oryzomonas rubra]